MGGIAEGAEIGVVRRDDEDPAAGNENAVELLHRGDHVRDVLDHVDGAERVKGTVAERIGKAVEVAQDIGARSRIAVDPDSPRKLIDAAADVKRAHLAPVKV